MPKTQTYSCGLRKVARIEQPLSALPVPCQSLRVNSQLNSSSRDNSGHSCWLVGIFNQELRNRQTQQVPNFTTSYMACYWSSDRKLSSVLLLINASFFAPRVLISCARARLQQNLKRQRKPFQSAFPIHKYCRIISAFQLTSANPNASIDSLQAIGYVQLSSGLVRTKEQLELGRVPAALAPSIAGLDIGRTRHEREQANARSSAYLGIEHQDINRCNLYRLFQGLPGSNLTTWDLCSHNTV